MNNRYMTFVLTVIAIGIVGINLSLWGVDLISVAEAAENQLGTKYNPMYIIIK